MNPGVLKKSNIALLAGVAAAAYVFKNAGKRNNMAGKVVLLTGGSRGLGLALARELAREGCKLILVARREDELLLAQRELRAYGVEVHILPCDLSQKEDLDAMLDKAKAFYGVIDIIINNAGRMDVAPVEALQESDFHAAMDLMLWTPVRIVLGLLPDLLRRGDADVVNISSIGGRVAVPHMLPYSTAKFALCGFSEGLDAELRSKGLRVLTVTPGLMRTGSHKQVEFRGKREEEYRWFALGATAPGVAMNVTRAARQIVDAVKRRRRSLTLTWYARAAAAVHGLSPALTETLSEGANALLPEPSGDRVHEKGHDLDLRQSSAVRAITALGEPAAEHQHENLAS